MTQWMDSNGLPIEYSVKYITKTGVKYKCTYDGPNLNSDAMERQDDGVMFRGREFVEFDHGNIYFDLEREGDG